MKTTFLAVGLSYALIGFALAVLYVYVLRRKFFGKFWGAGIVAVLGAFAGGVVEFLFKDLITRLSSINGIVNIFPPLIAASILLSVFAAFSESKDTYE